MIDARLSIPALFAWLVTGVLVSAPGAAWGFAIVFAGGFATTVTILMIAPSAGRERLKSVIGVVALSACIGGLVCVSVGFHDSHRRPASLLAAAESKEIALIEGIVTSAPESSQYADSSLSPRDGRATFTVVVTSVDTAPDQVHSPARVETTASRGELSSVRVGAEIRMASRVRAHTTDKPLAFRLFATQPPTVVSEPSGPIAVANELRARFSDAALALPGTGGALLPGLAIGDTSMVSPELDRAMKDSSLSHLTAVSGANCAVVVGIIFSLCAVTGMRRNLRIICSLLALAGFVVLVTPGPSVLRAATMALIVLVALARGRLRGGLSALCVAVIVLLVVDPWYSRSIGFALSVLATGGLILLTGPISGALSRLVPRTIARAIAVPVAAHVACQPVLILLDPSIPLLGVVANVLCQPAAPIATVIGLLGCLLLPLASGPAEIALWAAWVPADWIARVATWVAAVPEARIPWIAGELGVVTVSLASISACVAFVGFTQRRHHRFRLIASAVACTSVAVSLGAVFGGSFGRVAGMPRDWTVAACDVGQGDAFVVRSGDSVAVIDAGPSERDAAACLDQLGVGDIDLVVVTHFDRDHVGGLDAVLQRLSEGAIALLGRASRPSDERVIGALNDAGVQHISGELGQRGTLGDLSWRVLWPPNVASSKSVSGNDASVAVVFEGTGLTSLFLGDLGQASQDALLSASRVPRVDIVKVAHHGSADQSERLYRHIGAAVGLISVGERNRYGHPTDRVLDLLRASGTGVLRTDSAGLIIVAGDGEPRRDAPASTDPRSHLVVWTERASPMGAVHAGTISLDASRRETRGPHQKFAKRRRRSDHNSPGSVAQDSFGTARFGVGNRVIPRRSCNSRPARFIARRRAGARSERNRRAEL